MKMYRYIVHDSSTPCKKSWKGIFELLHLLIRGLIKGLSPNWPIFSTFLVEMHYEIVHTVPQINISPVPDTMSGSRQFVTVTLYTCRSSVYDMLLKFEILPVIVTGRKWILSVTHEIVPDSDRWPAVISCTGIVIVKKIKGLSTNSDAYCTFSIEMYCYIVRYIMSCKEYSESIFRFSHLLNRESIKGLSTN